MMDLAPQSCPDSELSYIVVTVKRSHRSRVSAYTVEPTLSDRFITGEVLCDHPCQYLAAEMFGSAYNPVLRPYTSCTGI